MKGYLLIFDFDECIIDSLKVQEISYNESCKKVFGDKLYPPFSEFLKYSGDSLENIMSKLGIPLEATSYYRELSNKNINLINIDDSLISLLRELHRNNKLAICSGKDHNRTARIIEYFDMKDIFDEIVCSDDVDEPKPSPQSVNLIINKLNMNKEKVIFIGDACNDMQCAKNANIEFILSSWYIDNKIEANYIAKTIDEFKTLLDSFN